MIDLNEKLSNILRILVELKNSVQLHGFVDNSTIDEQLRSLNFEANDFFENLTPEFGIDNPKLEEIIITLAKLVQMLPSSINKAFELKINLINLQIYIPIHLLFSLSISPMDKQLENVKYLEIIVNQLTNFEELPSFDLTSTMDQKQILDNYLRIFGSSGDLYYLLCSNLSIIKQSSLITWANRCFKQFNYLDKTLEKFNPLNFYKYNNLDVEDFYREIVGHYTILGNTNATNLLETLLGIDRPDILKGIDFETYIEEPSIEALEKKLERKAQKISELVNQVELDKRNNIYFKEKDDPLSIISFKLLITLEKYFVFTIAKIRTYKHEFNQLITPASTELKNCLSLCEDWLETTLTLTEKNENILDTPFGGLFNSVFLEYLLLVALDDGKTFKENIGKKPRLEEKLDKYNHIFLKGDHSLEQVADFIYYKTYAQIYVYCRIDDHKTLQILIDELYTILKFLDHKPSLKLNSLILLLFLEVHITNKTIVDLKALKEDILDMISQNSGLFHIKDEVQAYIDLLESNKQDEDEYVELLKERTRSKILDVNSWLLPTIPQLEGTKFYQFISFNQLGDRILKE